MIRFPPSLWGGFRGLLTRVASFLDPALAEERNALVALGSVCSFWRRAVLPVLFRKISIAKRGRAEEFVALQLPGIFLSTFVQELQVKVPKQDDQNEFLSSLRPLLLLETLRPTIIQIEHLQNFDLSATTHLSGTLPSIKSIREIKFRFCTFHSFSAFEKLLKDCPSLQTFQLDVVSWINPPKRQGNTVNTRALTIRVKSLTIGRHCISEDLIDWYFTRIDQNALVEVNLLSVDEDQLHTLEDLLCTACKSLKTLVCGFRLEGVPSAFQGSSLSFFTLRRLLTSHYRAPLRTSPPWLLQVT